MASTRANDRVARHSRHSFSTSPTFSDEAEPASSHAEVEQGQSTPGDGRLEFVNTFYNDNQDMINATATGLASAALASMPIEAAVGRVAETAQMLITGLDALAQIHPAIGVAVLAFKLVVSLDMTRRENDKAVLALDLEIQAMMAVLFELRHLKDPVGTPSDHSRLGSQMRKLMEGIAADIKKAASACDAYLKKNIIMRAINSMSYKTKLAEHISKFNSNKTEIQRCLVMHTARGVDLANEKLDKQGLAINKILEILRPLSSPEELEIERFVTEKGGADACIKDDALLRELVLKSGQTLSDAGGSIQQGNDLGNTRTILQNELLEDIDKMFEGHMVLFQGKLDLQSKQLREIQHLLTSGSHDRIVDEHLRSIWKEMDWKGSVEARRFVVALHDYFTGGFLQAPPQHTHYAAPAVDDAWALAYIDVTHVQPILEAIDDDSTGFVTIKEVNTFVNSSPKDWSLLQRLAFWAAGWHMSISSYKNKIYVLVQKMFKLLDRVLPPNRVLLDNYLKSRPLHLLEYILRSTKSMGETQHHPKLTELVNRFEAAEEARLTQGLKKVAYQLDGAETVTLVAGPGRVERYLFPLAYLLVKRDLGVITLACKHVLHQVELQVASRSLHSVMSVVEDRVERTTGILQQIHEDVNSRFGLLAFGMFQLYHQRWHVGGRTHPADPDNSYLKWQGGPLAIDSIQNLEHEISSIPLTELRFGPYHIPSLGRQGAPHTGTFANLSGRMRIYLGPLPKYRRVVYHGTTCDSCKQIMYETRFICLICIDKAFIDAVDICKGCLTTSFDLGKLNHRHTHSMIKYERVVHDYDEVWCSHTVVTRAKSALLQAGTVVSGEDEGKGATIPASLSASRSIRCAMCSAALTVPCWVCRVCKTPDTFICLKCEEEGRRPPEGHSHESIHPIIRIGSLDADPPIHSHELDAEERFADIETKIDKLTTQMKAIEDRFSTIEKLLRCVIEQTGDTPIEGHSRVWSLRGRRTSIGF